MRAGKTLGVAVVLVGTSGLAGCYSGLGSLDRDTAATAGADGADDGADDGGSADDDGADDGDALEEEDPGRVTLRRLNNTEYNNTIRDLFYGLDVSPAD